MTKSLWFKRTALLMCLLVLFLCLVPGFQQPAKAFVLVDDLAVFAIALLASSGILITSSTDFSSVVDYVGQSLSDFADSLGSSISDLIGDFALSAVGQRLWANLSASEFLSDWLPFFSSDLSLSNNDSVIAQHADYKLGDYDVFSAPFGAGLGSTSAYAVSITSSSEPVFGGCFKVGNPAYSLLLFSRAPFTVDFFWLRYTYNLSSGANPVNGWYWCSSSHSMNNPYYTDYLIKDSNGIVLTDSVFFSLLNSYSDLGGTSEIVVSSGIISNPVVVPDQDVIGISVPGVSAGDTVSDMLDSIETAYVEGDLVDSSYSVAQPVDSGFESPGLQSVFPFCIPFDLYHFFACLAADPVAPSFEIPFVVDGLVDYTFQIDLSAFESVAQVLRIMELLLFCIGLALVTRNLIRG